MHSKIFRFLLWICVILWLVVIFNFSAENGEKSDGQSRGLIIKTITNIIETAKNIGIKSKFIDELEPGLIAKKLNLPIRKAAHACVYLVLGFLLLFALKTNNSNFFKNSTIALILCFIYSLTDEYHQTLVPGRAGMFEDCIIDTIGCAFACVLYGFGILIGGKKHKRKRK